MYFIIKFSILIYFEKSIFIPENNL